VCIWKRKTDKTKNNLKIECCKKKNILLKNMYIPYLSQLIVWIHYNSMWNFIVHEPMMMYNVWTLYMNLKWCVLYEHCTWTYDDVSCMNIVRELKMVCLVWTRKFMFNVHTRYIMVSSCAMFIQDTSS
jgi:hypothetical protein